MLTVGINTLCNCLKNLFDLTKEKYSDKFERYISLQIAEKCVDMDFQHTEDKKVLEQLEKAKTGMDWYSGGISGILNCFSSIVTMFYHCTRRGCHPCGWYAVADCCICGFCFA